MKISVPGYPDRDCLRVSPTLSSRNVLRWRPAGFLRGGRTVERGVVRLIRDEREVLLADDLGQLAEVVLVDGEVNRFFDPLD